MNDMEFENKVNQDIDKAKEDVATLKYDVATLGEDGATGLGRIFDQLAGDTKQMVAVGVKTINQEVGQGLSQYNVKVQDFADRFPGDLGKKAAKYPWVTMTMSLAFGLMLGLLLKPGRQPVG
jgi:ElaB/YqjD/DUF883 family membrane-anchored ribosome-binding protein